MTAEPGCARCVMAVTFRARITSAGCVAIEWAIGALSRLLRGPSVKRRSGRCYIAWVSKDHAVMRRSARGSDAVRVEKPLRRFWMRA